jgi:hypothetical protein
MVKVALVPRCSYACNRVQIGYRRGSLAIARDSAFLKSAKDWTENAVFGWFAAFVNIHLYKVPKWPSLKEKHRLQSATCAAAMIHSRLLLIRNARIAAN